MKVKILCKSYEPKTKSFNDTIGYCFKCKHFIKCIKQFLEYYCTKEEQNEIKRTCIQNEN